MDEEIRAHLDRERWQQAFDLVLKHYQTKVFHLAVSILGNRELAEDASQEIFLRIWRALPAYRGASSLSTWIFSIARNASLTALKRASARRTISLEEPGMLAAAERQEPDRPTPDLALLVSQLPEKQRQVVTLFYMEEKSYEEVASLLDMPMGTVKTHLFRARKELALRFSKQKAQKENANAVRNV
jgi:RNA polymerase sigma-70 factor (ECF subfamily)